MFVFPTTHLMQLAIMRKLKPHINMRKLKPHINTVKLYVDCVFRQFGLITSSNYDVILSKNLLSFLTNVWGMGTQYSILIWHAIML